MRDSKELQQTVKDLRDDNYVYHFSRDYLQNMMHDAADTIERLHAERDHFRDQAKMVPTVEKLTDILSNYFQIGDSFTFELNRVKEAFSIGTMSFDDFVEWDEENVSDLAEYIMKKLDTEKMEEKD